MEPASEADSEFDVIVIGAGPVGENVADRAVRGGLSVALVEDRLAGGECSYWACIPTKSLLRPVELMAEAARLPSTAAAITGSLDVSAALARRDEMTGHRDDAGQVDWITSVPAAFIRGRGRLAGPRVVEVETDHAAPVRLTARNAVVVATGSRPNVPPIDGLHEAHPWTNREATQMKAVPKRVVLIGGGVVACELAQIFAGLGADAVTMLVRDSRLLQRAESFAGEMVRDGLRNAGVDVRFGTSADQVRRDASGSVTLSLTDGSTVEADEVVLGTGRTLNTDDIGLDTVGLPPGEPVEVDDSLRATGVSEGWLYAVGDANGRNLLTHMGKYQARACGDVIVARATGAADDRPSMRATSDALGAPQVIFTDPQVCAVGLTESAARDRGIAIRTVEYDIGAVSGAYIEADGYTGKAKAVIDDDADVMVGVTFVGPGVADLLHAATIAVTAQVPLAVLWHAVPAFPTVSEVWLRLLEADGR